MNYSAKQTKKNGLSMHPALHMGWLAGIAQDIDIENKNFNGGLGLSFHQTTLSVIYFCTKDERTFSLEKRQP